MEMGVAFSAIDNCEVYDIWQDKTTKLKGSQAYTTAEIPPHGSAAFQVKCLPF